MLHIGAAKTATTYIQHSLFDNAELLEQYGVYIPRSARHDLSPRTIVHHHLAWEYVEPERFLPENGGWDALCAEVEQAEAETVLISAESLERMVYTPERREILEGQLARLSDDVTIVYVVREQLSLMNSRYNQRVKSLRYTDTFAAYVGNALQSGKFDLDRNFHPWYDSTSVDFVAVPFDELVSRDPFVSLLNAAKIVIPEDLITIGKRTNESLGPTGLEVSRLLGAYLHVLDPEFDPKGDVALQTYRISVTRARKNGWAVEKYWGWDPADAAQIAVHFEDSNQRFARTLWNIDWPMPMPLDRAKNTIRLSDLAPEEIILAQRFVDSISRRYLELLTGGQYRVPPRANEGLQTRVW